MDNLLLESKFRIITYFALHKHINKKHFYSKNLYFVAFENLLNRIIKYGGKKNKITVEKRHKYLNNQLSAEYEKFCKIGIHNYGAKVVKNKTSLFMRKFLNKKAKPVGNNLSLAIIENKIIESTLIPQRK